MKRHGRQDIKLVKDKEKAALTLQKSAREMEDKLKRMGIERPHRGPRISDPAHTRGMGHSFSPSSEQRAVRRQSEQNASSNG